MPICSGSSRATLSLTPNSGIRPCGCRSYRRDRHGSRPCGREATRYAGSRVELGSHVTGDYVATRSHRGERSVRLIS
jgi:hypothetical protein